MNNPLNTVKGTLTSGVIITIVLVVLVRVYVAAT